MDLQSILQNIILFLPVFLFSLTVHEAAHAWMALKGGDDTSYQLGRLTLNPISHIDPIGTLALPLISMLSGIPLIGWAKPVPVNSLRLRSSIWHVWVALAGPASNVLIAIATAILMKVVIWIAPHSLEPSAGFINTVFTVLTYMVLVNIGLFLFNLIPIPPLDGSWVLWHFVIAPRRELWPVFDTISQYSSFVLLALLWTGGLRFVGYLANAISTILFDVIVF